MSVRDFADWQFPNDAYDEERDFSWETYYMLYLQCGCLVYSMTSMQQDLWLIVANLCWCVADYVHILAHDSGDRAWGRWVHYFFFVGLIFLAQSFRPQSLKGFVAVTATILITDHLLIRFGGEAMGVLSAIFVNVYVVWNIIWLRKLFILTQSVAFVVLLWNDVLGKGGHFWTEFAVCCTFTVCKVGLLMAKQEQFQVLEDKRDNKQAVSGHFKST